MMQIMSTSDQPWELDTRHLAALVAIARTKSVSKAAEQLNYVQSAVSQQLATLERIVGQRLVDRGTGPRPVTLTAAGAVLLPHAAWIIDRLAAARTELHGLESGTSGSIRIGTFQSAGARLLPQVLAAFRAQWPSITISIHNEVEPGELTALVRSGVLDVAFVESVEGEAGLMSVELMKDLYVALIPPNHALAARASISLADFAGEDLVAASAPDVCSLRIDQAMRAAGFEPRIAFRTDDNATRQRLVDAGLGCAVQPGLTVERGLHNGGVIIPLTEAVYRTINLTWSADRTKSFALSTFIDVTTQVLEAMAASRSS